MVGTASACVVMTVRLLSSRMLELAPASPSGA
jgi:hypothetical protein